MITWFHGPLLEVLDIADASAANAAGYAGCIGGCLGGCLFPTRGAIPSWNSWVATRSNTSALQVIPNPHPAWPAARPAPPPAAPHTVRCGDVGRLSPEKRPELLIDTLTQLPQHYALQITGEGSLKSTLQIDAAARAPGRIQWQGFQPATPALYQAHHVTLLTSAYEGCPMAVLESWRPVCPALVCRSLHCVMLGSHMPYALAEDHSGSALAQAVLRVMSTPTDFSSGI